MNRAPWLPSAAQQGRRRVARAEKQLLALVTEAIRKEGLQKSGHILTVARVILSADFRHGKVFVSLLGEETDSFFEGFLKESHKISHFVASQWRARHCPKLQFFRDETTDKILKIEGFLHALNSTQSLNPGNETTLQPSE